MGRHDDERDPAAGVLGGDVLGPQLQHWLAEAATDEAARERSRRRRLREQAAADATLTGLLRTLAERGEPVTLGVGASRVSGQIAVGADFVVVTGGGPSGLVPLAAIESVAPGPGTPSISDDREPASTLSLAAVLDEAAVDRPDLVVVTRSGAEVRGALRRAGADAIEVARDCEPRVPVWVAHQAIAVIWLDG